MQLIECLKSNLSIFEYKENIQKNWITTTGSPNFAKIYNSGLPIKSVVEQDGLVNTYKILNLMLNRFLQYFNLAIKMSEDQVAEYACQMVDLSIIDGYTLEDFAVFFEKAKTGIYGVPKVSIDGAFINTMLDKYNLERQKSINEYRAKIEHNQKLGIYDDTTPQRRYNPQTQEFEDVEPPNPQALVPPEKISEFVKDFQQKVSESKEEKIITAEQKEALRQERIANMKKNFNERFNT